MRKSNTGIFALAAALFAITAHDALAQGIVQRSTTQRRGWLGFSYETVVTRSNNERRQVIDVVEVVSGSPAERAGLQVGDTILSINDLRISETFMQSLSYSVAPGDAVRLRLRRAGNERTISVTATERPAQYDEPRAAPFIYEITPDSIRRRMNIYLDSARFAVDSLYFPRLRVERTPGGTWVYTDSARFRFFGDTVRAGFGRGGGVFMFPGDASDSVFVRYRAFTDSMFRSIPRAGFVRADSMMFMKLDSIRTRFGELQPGRVYSYSLRGDGPVTVMPNGGFGISVFGMRAVGGAELTELNPALGEYFGTNQGVLVVRVPDETPAERAGLEPGDVIVRANGTEIASVTQLRQAIAAAGSSSIRLEILRKKARRTIELRDN